MTCCSIASGCGIPVTGCTGSTVAAGYVLVDLVASQMPFYVDTCKGDMYYWDGTKWIMLGKDSKYLTYDTATRQLTLMPDGSSVNLPVASSTVAGLVKVGNGSPISITTDGVLVIDCAVLKTSCGLLGKDVAPTGNVVYFNTTTNMLDIDCALLKAKCGLVSMSDLPVSGNVVKIDPASKRLEVDCSALKAQCNLATMADIPAAANVPVSGAVVKVNPTTHELELDCAALKASCNLASMSDIPATGASVDWGQQATLTGTTLHIANTQDPTKGVDVDLSSLAGTGGGTVSGGGAEKYLMLTPVRTGNADTNRVGAHLFTKHGKLLGIEIVANKVWDGSSGSYVAPYVLDLPDAGEDFTHTPITPIHSIPIGLGGLGGSSANNLYWKIGVGGLILRYANATISNDEVCGNPFGLTTAHYV